MCFSSTKIHNKAIINAQIKLSIIVINSRKIVFGYINAVDQRTFKVSVGTDI